MVEYNRAMPDATHVRVHTKRTSCAPEDVDALVSSLDHARGVMLSSRYEFPGRYTRWDIGMIHPPLVIEAVGDELYLEALNERGKFLVEFFHSVLSQSDMVIHVDTDSERSTWKIVRNEHAFVEEDRSKQPHVMNVIRLLRDSLSCNEEHVGFYGAFGYDLGIDFMGVTRTHSRSGERDLVLYLADEIFVTDHQNQSSYVVRCEFEGEIDGEKFSTQGYVRTTAHTEYKPLDSAPSRDMEPGEYARVVDSAQGYFARGDLFEVVPSQTFVQSCAGSPSEVFTKLLDVNPAPYGALINLGHGEWTVSASPEMFVRVEGSRVESCPIAGTIARGSDTVSDNSQIETLLASKKEESELTMCTDVDRNDKSRVCDPSTINVIGRRQIEMYSRLIHTVDHVEGQLLDGYDAIDAFMTHMWAVTVTGAPKMWAMNFIEQFEKSPRRFYGGSMGYVGCDGSMNTGLMLRTIHFCDGRAHVRAGATLLADSDSQAEERETELKASALLDVLQYCDDVARGRQSSLSLSSAAPAHYHDDKNGGVDIQPQHENKGNDIRARVLLVDCEDSFVHTLAGYFRMSGAQVRTRRVGFSPDELISDIEEFQPTLLCLSPGPGSPTDFGLSDVIETARAHSLPIFGVCLGLQALVEYFGGTLGQLDVPVHGKPSSVVVSENPGWLFEGIASPFEAGRYHSLYADPETFPTQHLKVTARTADDGVIMAVEHVSEPIAAVQFHPESIMTIDNQVGRTLIENVIRRCAL